MNKRGDIEINLYFFLELVAGILIASIAINIAMTLAKGTVYEKLNIAEDIGMQINTIISLPGDAYIVDNNLHGYSVSVVDNRVEVYSEILDVSKAVYYFPKTETSNFDAKLTTPKQIIISKVSGQIIISEEILNGLKNE